MRKKKWTIFRAFDAEGNAMGDFKSVKERVKPKYFVFLEGIDYTKIKNFEEVRKETITDPEELHKCIVLEQGWNLAKSAKFKSYVGDLVVSDGVIVWLEDYDNGFSENVKYWRHLPSPPKLYTK